MSDEQTARLIAAIEGSLLELKAIVEEGDETQFQRWRESVTALLTATISRPEARRFQRETAQVASYYAGDYQDPDSRVSDARQFLQGLMSQVRRSPSLVLPAPTPTPGPAPVPLHPVIQEVAAPRLAARDYPAAVQQGASALEAHVRRLSGQHDLSGAPLMLKVFAQDAPILKLANLSTKHGRDEQQGFMYLFAGAVKTIRNPANHGGAPNEPERALEYVQLLSLLAKLADEAERQP